MKLFLGKPLIVCTHRFSEHGDKDTNCITISDIWPENYSYFTSDLEGRVKFTPPSVNITQPRVKSAQGVGQKLPKGRVKITHKEEPFKKNIHEEQQQQANSAVVFSCLVALDESEISKSEKERITKKYQSEEKCVIDAVAVITHKDFKPDKTLLKSLNAACRGKWKPGEKSENQIAETIGRNKESLAGYDPVFKIQKQNIVFNSGDELSLVLENKEFMQKFGPLFLKNVRITADVKC